MAHHIAELMERVETEAPGPERDRAAEACRTAILDAWGRRQSWPYGGPLERLAPVLSALAGPPKNRWSEPEQPDPPIGWFALYEDLHDLDIYERRIVVDVEAAAMDLDAERRSLAEGGGEMEPQERKTLEWFIDRAEATESEDYRLGPVDAPGFRSLDAKAQRDLIGQAFEELARQRAEVVHRAVAALRGPEDKG